MAYKLTDADIAAIDLFIDRAENMQLHEILPLYGWKHAQSFYAVSNGLKKIGVPIGKSARTKNSGCSGAGLAAMKERWARLRAFEAGQAAAKDPA